MAWLVYHPGLPDERAYALPQGRTGIGRAEDNNICLPHEGLSRKHAEIVRTGNEVRVIDLKSTNGSFVNGTRVDQHVLAPGDEVRFGSIILTFQHSSPSSMRPAVRPTRAAAGLSGPPRAVSASSPPSPVYSPSPSLVIDLPRALKLDMESVAARLQGARQGDESGPQRKGDAERLEILLQVSELLSQPKQVDAKLREILGLVAEILHVDRAVILLADDDGNLTPSAARNRGAAVPPEEGTWSSSAADYARQHGVAALFSDAMHDPRLASTGSILHLEVRSCMTAPLRSMDGVIGVLYVDNVERASFFTKDDLQLLGGLANQAAIAIENAALYERVEREAVLRNTLLRFFPPATIGPMLDSGRDVFGTVETEVTALFVDISGYTSIVSSMMPREVVEMLNRYFAVLSSIVFKYEGTLEKYIGDALMAVWGAPTRHDDDAERAVLAAMEMQRGLVQLNAEREAIGTPPLRVHMGIHTGMVAAGNIGTADYLQYAAIGDTTNVTARICSLAGPDEILLSAVTAAKLPALRFALEPLGLREIRGKKAPIDVLRLPWR